MSIQVVHGVAGGCFWCDDTDADLSIKTIKCTYDNGEPTTATLAVCDNCKGRK